MNGERVVAVALCVLAAGRQVEHGRSNWLASAARAKNSITSSQQQQVDPHSQLDLFPSMKLYAINYEINFYICLLFAWKRQNRNFSLIGFVFCFSVLCPWCRSERTPKEKVSYFCWAEIWSLDISIKIFVSSFGNEKLKHEKWKVYLFLFFCGSSSINGGIYLW